jgi:hypothetical protein
VAFDRKIPAFEQAKTVHALNRAVAVIARSGNDWLIHYTSTSDEASSNSTDKRFFGTFIIDPISS